MFEQSLFSLASTPDADLERTGGMDVAVDETFSTAAPPTLRSPFSATSPRSCRPTTGGHTRACG
jgi:hypothetical protein